MISRLPAVVGAFAIGAALLLSACSSGSTHSTPPPSPKPTKTAAKGGFAAGPNPCRLVTPTDILATLKERMVATSRSSSTCAYQNATKTDTVSVSTASMTPTEAKAAVISSGNTVKGTTVQHLTGLGDTAIAYLNVSKGLSVGTCLFANKGVFVFLHVDRPHPAHLLQDTITLSRTAASRT